MIVQLIIILFFGFCWSYPLFLIFTPQEKIQDNFYHFNLGLSIIVGSLALIINYYIRYFSLDQPFSISINLIFIYIFIIIFLSLITWYFWKKKYPLFIIIVISILGLSSNLYNFYFDKFSFTLLNTINYFSSLVGTLSLSCVIFSMILGHWYLNIPNLPINLIRKLVFVLNSLLILRLIFNIIIIFFSDVSSDLYGNIKFIYFLQSFEGIILWIGILFGIIGAIVINILTIQSIKLHSIQSATGLLYVNLIMILMGEMIFKYYMITKEILL